MATEDTREGEVDQQPQTESGPANQAQVWLAEILVPQGLDFWLRMSRGLATGTLREVDVNNLHGLSDPLAAADAVKAVEKKMASVRDALEAQAEATRAFIANPSGQQPTQDQST